MKKIGKLKYPQSDPERLSKNVNLQVLMERMEANNQQFEKRYAEMRMLRCVKLILRNSG
jgi:hypothetical protein